MIATQLKLLAIIFSVIAPLISVLALATFGTTWFVFRYEIIYISKPQKDTFAKGYPLALNQLLTGLYTMHICVIGLFLLERTPENHLACLPQALLMLSVASMTIIFQIVLTKAFQSLVHSLPLLGQPIKERPGIWTRIWDIFRGCIGARNTAWQSRQSTVGERSMELSAINYSPQWTDLSGCDSRVGQDSTGLENPYADTLHWTLWLPRDPYSFCAGMISQLHQLHPRIKITNEGASMDSAGRLEISQAPDSIR